VAVEQWLAAEPARPEHVSAADWLSFEQEKHQRLLAESAARAREHLAREHLIDDANTTDTTAAATTPTRSRPRTPPTMEIA
jgi:hypothetical protein